MEFKKDAEISTGDFWYDMFEGGYIRPEELLEDIVEIATVNYAISILRGFKESAEEADIINYL